MKNGLRIGRLARHIYILWLVLWLATESDRTLSVQAQEVVNLIGLAPGNVLVHFQSATPGTIDNTVPISGLSAGEAIAAIDFRPATGQLYGLGITETPGAANGRLYVIDPATGVAAQVGITPFSNTLANGANYGFDFNPVADRIRVVNDADANFRLNPDTGLLAAMDVNLDNSADTEAIVASAYDRNRPGTTVTTLFGIDFENDTLVLQGGIDGTPSPNGGLIITIGSLGVIPATPQIGFDIAGADGMAYATWQDSSGSLFHLYTVHLSTGAATLAGTIGDGTLPILGLTVAPTWDVFLPFAIK